MTEIDELTYPTLRVVLDAALFGAVDQTTTCVVVDLAGVTFCNVRGFTLLADTAQSATAAGTGYVLSGCSTHFERCWRFLGILYPNSENSVVTRYASTAAPILAIRADHRTHLAERIPPGPDPTGDGAPPASKR